MQVDQSLPHFTSSAHTLESFLKNVTTNTKFTVLHINIRSLNAHFDDLLSFLTSLNFCFPLICLSETWLSQNVPLSTLQIPSYKLICQNRQVGKGGGVAIYVHDNLPFTILNNINFHINHSESIFIEFCINGMKYIGGTIYRKPGTPISEFLVSLENCLNFLSLKNKKSIILGDFNIDYSATDTTQSSYVSLLESYIFVNVFQHRLE